MTPFSLCILVHRALYARVELVAGVRVVLILAFFGSD